MSNQGKLSKYNIYNILYVALFVVISSLLLWKCRFGYATLDEAFYPTIAYRFIQGDAILSEEWNNTQLSNLILIPILKCYINTKGNLDGIYLTIRYMYTVCKILISCYEKGIYIIDIDFVYKFMYWFYIGWNDEVTFL